MANSTTGRTWLLDTAATISSSNPIHIAKMIWYPNDASQTLLVQNGAGARIWGATSLTAAPAGTEVWENSAPNMPFCGFKLATLTAGGTLEVVTV